VPPSESEPAEGSGAVAAIAVEAEVAAEVAAEGEVVDGNVAADGQPKRKRSRRGSRGGRKRRKPSANGDQVESDASDVSADAGPDEPKAGTDVELAAVPGPSVEVTTPEYTPMSEWIEDFDSRSRSS
jgi:hypothetical protein